MAGKEITLNSDFLQKAEANLIAIYSIADIFQFLVLS